MRLFLGVLDARHDPEWRAAPIAGVPAFTRGLHVNRFGAKDLPMILLCESNVSLESSLLSSTICVGSCG